jgi:hypothetical protein
VSEDSAEATAAVLDQPVSGLQHVPEVPSGPRRTWRRIGLGAALSGAGFVAGLVAAPWLNQGGWLLGRQAGSIAVERQAPRPDDGPLPVTASHRRDAARLLLAASSLASAAGPIAAPAATEVRPRKAPVTFETLPAPVREALNRLAAGKPLQRLQLREGERDRDGQPVFAMHFDLEAVEHEIVVDAQGKLIEAQIDVAVGELPHSLTEQIFMAVPDAVLIEAERRESENEAPFYEVELRSGGVRREVRLSESGEIIRNKVK